MSFESSIAENVRTEIEELIELVSGKESQKKTAYEIEGQLWRGMLAVGRELMQLFFATREEQEERQKVYEADGNSYVYVGQRERSYVSLFGKVRVGRAGYWLKGAGNQYPLDEGLSLPQRSFSDWVQERVSELSLSMSYDDAVGLFSKWLDLDLPKRSSEQMNGDHAEYARAYYETRAVPEIASDDSILVVSADGKGIPMTRKDSPPPAARRGRGTKKTAKKEATVTAIYTIAPYKRTSDAIVRALLPGQTPERDPLPARPTPTNKQIFGTLAGQQNAFEHLLEQLDRRDDDTQLQHYVALTDGNPGLKKRVRSDLPRFTLIVDIIHVTEYLWKAANILLGETHFMRELWMQDALRCLLEDDLDTLLAHLDYQLPALSQSKQVTLKKVSNYLRNNREFMDYHLYLARGYPIGTGVIEGACRYLVKDRFERSGMRWSLSGAQVMLDLRAIHLNHDWLDFHRFRRQQAHQQRYGSSHPDAIPEAIMLSVAA
jgi:hypothetical protein